MGSNARSALVVGVEAVVALTVLALVAGSVLGQPILLGYVETGSMSPTLEPGDGFVAVPADVAGEVDRGDVVVFEAEELNGGGLTTHRVVGETDRGFVTKGDANPFTDQEGDEPPVKRAQVVAVAWRAGGDVVVIPELGTVVETTGGALTAVQTRLAAAFGTRSLLGVQGLAYLLFGASVLAYVLLGLFEDGTDRERQRERETGTSTVLVVVGLMALVVAGATAGMVAPSGTQQLGVVSAESDSPGARVIATGTSETVEYSVHNAGLVPVDVFLETSDGATVTPDRLQVASRTTVNTTLTLSAPPETGYYRRFVTEYRYLSVLPSAHLEALYDVHPWAPIVVIDVLLAVPVGIFVGTGLGRSRLRTRSREKQSRLHRLYTRVK
jgi:signal peptidase